MQEHDIQVYAYITEQENKNVEQDKQINELRALVAELMLRIH